MDEPTAWQDINPMTALARQAEQPLQRSASFAPASTEQFAAALTSCLALVAPSGMEESARREWLQVAWDTLKDLPADLLERGCRKARETCDHPAKIVPAILAETAEPMKWRRESERDRDAGKYLPPPRKRHVLDRRGEAMSESDTFELNKILEKLGARARYRADGSRYLIDKEA